MSNKKILALAIAMASAASTPALAQWSSEPATSAVEVISAGNSPQLAADNSGGVYVSYRNGTFYDYTGYRETSGFDVFLQHYDANGNQSWEAPVRVFDTNKQYTSYYAVATDEDGNAYIANDIFPGQIPSVESRVHVAKVNQDGTPAWDVDVTPGNLLADNGLGITMGAHGDHIAVAWSQGATGLIIDAFSGLAVLNKDGEVLWKQDIQFGARYTYATTPVVTDDGVIVLMEVATQPGSSQANYVVQKYALADGKPMWSEPVSITSGDNFSHKSDSARSVKVIADGEGGVVVGWHHPIGINQGYLLLQHVHANGDKDFSGQGLRISGDNLGNGGASLAYDGDNIYVVWTTFKKDYDEEGAVRDFYGMRGTALSREGEFLWSEKGSSEPLELMPWRPMLVNSTIPQEEWFRGYMGATLSLNQDDNLNLTYGVETNQAYHLFAQVIDATSGTILGERVNFSDGAIKVTGFPATTRTNFGQPVFAYGLNSENRFFPDGAIKLVNFDGTGHSGVSQDILVEKSLPITLAPGEEKSIDLKVLDNTGSAHDNSVTSTSTDVRLTLNGNDTSLNLGVATHTLLAASAPITVKVQDVSNSTRAGTSTIKVRAPHSVAPVIAPMADVIVNEHESATVTAAFITDAEGLQLQWAQTSGPAVSYEAEGTSLQIHTDYVAADTQLTFTLTANDAVQQTSQSVNVTVKNTSSPAISGANAEASPGAQFTLTPKFSGAKAPLILTWSQTGGASTVYTMTDSGVLTGTAPLTEGSVTLTLQAVDANGEALSKDFNLSVSKPEKSKKRSGGSFGFPAALLLGLAALIRRRFGMSN